MSEETVEKKSQMTEEERLQKVDELLDQYLALKADKEQMDPADYKKKTRDCRRRLRQFGFSIRALTKQGNTEEADESEEEEEDWAGEDEEEEDQ